MKNPTICEVIRMMGELLDYKHRKETVYQPQTYFTYSPSDAFTVEDITRGTCTIILEADGTPVFKVDFKIPVK